MDASSPAACLILDGLPKSSFCGIDLLSFTTSEKFRGIRNLPRGWHFVFAGVNSALSIRHGAWFRVEATEEPAPEIFIKKWDALNEELVTETDEHRILEWRANLGSLWRERLAPYRQSASREQDGNEDHSDEYHDWQKLTDAISESLLSRINGQDNALNHWSLTSASAAKRDIDHIPGLSHSETELYPDKDLNFLPIDLRQTWRQGAVGRERTDAAQDRSWALNHLVQSNCESISDIVGELQFCFLMVLTLNNNSCLSQWKRILELVLTSTSAILKETSFFVHVLSTLKLQLEHCEDADGGLFDMADEEGNLLKTLLGKFRKGLDQLSGHAKSEVMDELDEVEDYLRAQHGWLMNESYVRRGLVQLEDGEQVELDMNGADEDDESGEFAPTVVDLTPEQAAYLQQETAHVPSSKREQTQDSVHSISGSEDEEDQDLDGMDMRF